MADADLERLLGEHRDDFLQAFANDLQPLRTAIESALQQTPYGPDLNSRLIVLKARLPEILVAINDSPKSAPELANIMARAFKLGFEK